MKRNVLELTEMPQELLCSGARIILNGNRELLLDSCKGIVELSDTQIIVKLSRGRLCIEGACLCIHSFCCTDVVIRGEILSIRFM